MVDSPTSCDVRSRGTRARRWPNNPRFSIATGVPVYFCDPRSPWQDAGSNEHTNGLLRQYFPKRSDLKIHTQAHLDAVADELNGRPRQTLHWKSTSEALERSRCDDRLRPQPISRLDVLCSPSRQAGAARFGHSVRQPPRVLVDGPAVCRCRHVPDAARR